MQAVVKFADGREGWDIREVPRPDPGPDEVEIQVRAAGICGSELHLYHDNHAYLPGTVVGHEYAGVISRVGGAVRGWKVGDRVVSENHKATCGVCGYCRSGQPIFCPQRQAVGYAVDGGWTSYICQPTRLLLPIPDGVSDEEAAMTEPCSIVVQALCIKAPIRAGETVLVNGCGSIGLIAAQVARAAGAKRVIITGTDDDAGTRFAAAEAVGLEQILNVSRCDLTQAVEGIVGPEGVDTVVEASGAVEAINASLGLLRKGGRMIAIGEAPQAAIPVRWNRCIFGASSILFTFGAEYRAWKLALQLMEEGRLRLQPLITHRLPLRDYARGFDLLDRKEGIKIMLYPQD